MTQTSRNGKIPKKYKLLAKTKFILNCMKNCREYIGLGNRTHFLILKGGWNRR